MKYNVLHYLYGLLKKYGVIALLSCLSIFLLGSLITFSSTDASWFYHSNQLQSYKNIFGFFGAHSAAWSIYFFGSAAFLLLPLLVYFVGSYFFVLVTKKVKFATEWDRAVGMVIGFLSSTMFFQVYHFASYDFTYSGGVVGNYLTKLLLTNFDQISQKIIVTSLLLSSIILVARCSYIPLFRSIFKSFQYVFDRKKLPARVCYKLFAGMLFAGAYAIKIMKNLYDLLSGAIVERIDSSIVEFEYEKDIDKDIDQVVQDLFWDDYIDEHKIKTARYESQNITNSSHIEKFESEAFDAELEQSMMAKNIEFQSERNSNLFDLPMSSSVNTSKENSVKLPEKVHAQQVQAQVQEKPVAKKKVEYALPFLPIKKIEQKVMIEKQEALAIQAKLLEEKLAQFDIKGTVGAMHAGPVVILFEYQPDIKVKVSRILSLEDDLAMALRALSIRIIAPIPGRSVVGFEVANRDRQDVLFSTILDSPEFKKNTGSLPMIFGQDTLGNNVVADLAKMPHLLIAGSTGSGKSVALNAMLVSLLCSLRPDQLKLIIIDPKRLEFAAYDGIAHLIFPIVTETKKAIPVLKWVVQTMEERYKIMASHGVRNLSDYQAAAKSNKDMEPMPLIVVIIDELADLMMTAGKAVEDSIARIAQMARAAGIHMIIATQRPSVDVITGMIKVNFPNRVAFKVTSKIDSRTILDASGAEKLLGRGDMLFLDASKSNLVRVHGAYVSDAEIHGVVAQIKAQQTVQYLDLFEQFGNHQDDEVLDADDELYQEVITLLKDLDEVSISMLQRRFRIGYNRSARIISILESKGLIMSIEGGKTRRVVR